MANRNNHKQKKNRLAAAKRNINTNLQSCNNFLESPLFFFTFTLSFYPLVAFFYIAYLFSKFPHFDACAVSSAVSSRNPCLVFDFVRLLKCYFKNNVPISCLLGLRFFFLVFVICISVHGVAP